ncbi:MAG: hypothetical protein ACI4IL_00605 [Eubacterium sp.]
MHTKNENILEYPIYKDINDFKESLLDGREIVLKWDNIEYSIEYEDDTNSDFSICEAYKTETENHFESIDELLEFKLKTGEILKNVVLQAEIMWRNI